MLKESVKWLLTLSLVTLAIVQIVRGDALWSIAFSSLALAVMHTVK